MLESTFFYCVLPGESEARALDQIHRVYGVRNIFLDERRYAVRVEYDASRLSEFDIAALLAEAGFELREWIKGEV